MDKATLIPVSLRVFTEEDQCEFASLSGDFNPIHTDALAARRVLFGEPVVHGIHALMWVLDAVSAKIPRARNGECLTVRARFRKPIFLGESVFLVQTSCDDRGLQFALRRDESVLVSIRLEIGVARDDNRERLEHTIETSESLGVPLDPTFDEAACSAGRLCADEMVCLRLLEMFPSLGQLVGARRLGEVALISNVVGMRIPGRHSLFAAVALSIQLKAANESANRASIEYSAESASRQFKMISIGVRAPGMHALAEAFFRPAPVPPPPMQMLQNMIDADIFTGHRVLVVGGSRGLGAILARLLAVGGADVRITFANGVVEATTLASHPRITCSHLDTGQLKVEEIEDCFKFPVDTLIYCATPRIFFRRTKPMHFDRLHGFMECYVYGFGRIFERFAAQSLPRSTCLYPSSVEVESENAETVEYRIAKHSAEILCAELAVKYPQCQFETPRLPRLDTDQTAMIGSSPSEETVPLMLELLVGILGGRRKMASSQPQP
jgi:acyl dehydratase